MTLPDSTSSQIVELAQESSSGPAGYSTEDLGDPACSVTPPENVEQDEKATDDLPQKKSESKSRLVHYSISSTDTRNMNKLSQILTDEVPLTLRLTLADKCVPLTTLSGSEFIKAWLDAAKALSYLWAMDVGHGDPSLWNVVYNAEKKHGVLRDFDLGIEGPKRAPITGRLGTVPFIGIKKSLRIELLPTYRNDMEALIWILPFVFLRWRKGKICKDPWADKWLTWNAFTLADRKADFLYTSDELQKQNSSAEYDQQWPVAASLLSWANPYVDPPYDDKLRQELGAVDFNSVEVLWPSLIHRLKQRATAPKLENDLGYLTELVDELKLESILDGEQAPSVSDLEI